MTMGIRGFKTKKQLKDAIKGRPNFEELRIETSWFGEEYKGAGSYVVVGPCPHTSRRWFAEITCDENGYITKVT